MLTDLIRTLQEKEARRNADKLPTSEEFAELSNMMKMGSIAGGAHLSPEQCRLFSETFATLSVAVIAVDQSGC